MCSILVYGSEGWLLDKQTCAILNGASGAMVTAITGQSPREECTPCTRTFDIVRNIRARRLQWVGHILRMDWGRLVHKAVRCIYEDRSEGDILMDIPECNSWWELMEIAGDRDKWRGLVRKLKASTATKWRCMVRKIRELNDKK